MLTISRLKNQMRKELERLDEQCAWNVYHSCSCGDKVLYGPHIGVRFYYEEDEPVQATFEFRDRVTKIFRKYYSRKARFYKARHGTDGSFIPPKSMLTITLLI